MTRLPADEKGRGKAVFVPFTLPGEKVEASIEEEKPGFARARGGAFELSVRVAFAMIAVVLLITDLLFSLGWAIAATALIAVAFGWFWYGLALLRRAERG